MDLKLLPAETSGAERAAVDSVLERQADVSGSGQVAHGGLTEATSRSHILVSYCL